VTNDVTYFVGTFTVLSSDRNFADWLRFFAETLPHEQHFDCRPNIQSDSNRNTVSGVHRAGARWFSC
jgi:hypothetical protein